ncbi:nuclear transport factor 2 family protein [Paraburkholderia fungorum]|uniref:nuclear transport factor 2 family protein n=1 Tax=Paraburkholderia fungorum TaxID=134537 RepID=UPI0038BC1228
MKRTVILTTLGLLLMSSAASYSYAATSDEATLLALEQSWAEAASIHDEAVLDKVLDDSFVEVTANGTRRGKADALAAPGLPAGSSQSLSELKARVSGDTAVVTGVNDYTPAPGALAVKFVFTDIYARRPDGWRAISARMARESTQ